MRLSGPHQRSLFVPRTCHPLRIACLDCASIPDDALSKHVVRSGMKRPSWTGDAPGPANRHQLVGQPFIMRVGDLSHRDRRHNLYVDVAQAAARRLKIGKYAPPLLSCLCRTGLWAVWRMRGNADFCEFAKAYALCASCAYNDSDANLFAVGQTVGQPARTVVDISDRPHAAAATHIRIPGQRFCPDTEEVTGSNPVSPTSNIPSQRHFLDRASGIRATNAQQGRA